MLVQSEVDLVILEFAGIRLGLHPSGEVQISGSIEQLAHGVSSRFEATAAASHLDEVYLRLGKALEARILDGGSLEVAFEDGVVWRCDPDLSTEAWSVGFAQRRWISSPGGEVTIFGP